MSQAPYQWCLTEWSDDEGQPVLWKIHGPFPSEEAAEDYASRMGLDPDEACPLFAPAPSVPPPATPDAKSEGLSRPPVVCACMVVAPCGYACSCANPIMSGGCSRCATYGSDEQRRAAAEDIAERDAKAQAAEGLAEAVEAQIARCTVGFCTDGDDLGENVCSSCDHLRRAVAAYRATTKGGETHAA